MSHLVCILQAESVKITSLEKCDFKPMAEYFDLQKEKKKAMTAAEKKQQVSSPNLGASDGSGS
jgi:hypothetical protein